MASGWSPGQFGMLRAMGLSPMRLRVAGPAAATDGVAAIDFEHPLFAPVWHASGLDPARPSEFDWAAWARSVGLPPLEVLAADPGAKRQLWHRLRAARGHRA